MNDLPIVVGTFLLLSLSWLVAWNWRMAEAIGILIIILTPIVIVVTLLGGPQ